MKKIFLLSFLILIGSIVMVNAQKKAKIALKKVPVSQAHTHWTVDPVHSSVNFSVTHMTISEVDGSFKKFEGNIDAPAPDFNHAAISFKIDVNSITTDNDNRDKHLKSDDFFNAEKYPYMTFVTTSFKKVKGNAYILEGNLTIRDVTRKVKFPVLYGGTITDPQGNLRAGFKASGKISRKEFGLKWNKLTEAGGAMVGDEVTIKVNVELIQQKS